MPEGPLKAQTLKGFRDFLPEQMVLRQHVIGTLRRVFEQHGFEPLETPTLEYAETLEGKYGDEERLLYRFTDQGDRRVGMRYDLTVPLARVVGQYVNSLAFPFKRYQIQPVWRADRPQKGRYREFYQCDADIVGTSSPLADAECVSLYYEGLRDLGFVNYQTLLNSRKLLTAIGIYAGAGEQAGGIFRAIDKLVKIGEPGVLDEMAASGVSSEAARRALDLAKMSEGRRDQADDLKLIANLRQPFADIPVGLEGLDELDAIVKLLPDFGVPDRYYKLDLTLARGLNYYTGAVFEVVSQDIKIGSLGGGGRYDELVGIFSGRSIPTVGASFGLERIIDVIEEAKIGGALPRTTSAVFVTVFNADLLADALAITRELRAAGINTEVAYEPGSGLKKQLDYAARKGIGLAIIEGPDEQASGEVILREVNLSGDKNTPRVQQSVLRSEVVAAVKAKLGMG
ncbi:MAG: histidine--tRNA ligase [Candidatus Chloroheliales bacterium]|nr:MAG: histidine--tRNA ligase [Chloroflexota bacterium]